MKHRLKFSKQLNVFITNCLALIFLILIQTGHLVAFTIKLNQTQTTQLKLITQNFKDPMVWDSNSLYKSTSKIKHPQSLERLKRSASSSVTQQQQFVDACPTKMEILTPYYAKNSQGKLRTVVNSELMQQAIQIETCIRSPLTSQSAAKCNAQLDCGCEQKYKWHRLLVLDPRDSGVSRGLFMDWFLFPSNCVCRCKTLQSSSKQFLRSIKRFGNE